MFVSSFNWRLLVFRCTSLARFVRSFQPAGFGPTILVDRSAALPLCCFIVFFCVFCRERARTDQHFRRRPHRGAPPIHEVSNQQTTATTPLIALASVRVRLSLTWRPLGSLLRPLLTSADFCCGSSG